MERVEGEVSYGMDVGDRVAYVDNNFPSLGVVRAVGNGERKGQWLVDWDDVGEDDERNDWYHAGELAVIEKGRP